LRVICVDDAQSFMERVYMSSVIGEEIDEVAEGVQRNEVKVAQRLMVEER
jgi:hypothetical protein